MDCLYSADHRVNVFYHNICRAENKSEWIFHGDNTYYIKRIIGMPGETVQIKNGYVYIDGERLLSDIYGNELIKDPQTAADPITLKENEYFVMGDNRNHSMDSRDPSVGVLTKEDLIGRAWVRIYPFDNIGVIRHE